MQPHDFWQQLEPPGTFDADPPDGFAGGYPATLPDGRQLLLPIRVLPGGTDRAVASLILNQASFAVADALADVVAERARAYWPEVVVGVPTLGLVLAEAVARRLGHGRLVPLGTSRKFWYEDRLSEPLSSITTPEMAKRLYLDPRMLPLVEGRRVLLVDDAVSSGRSMAAALKLLRTAGVEPVALAVAMVQTERWRAPLADAPPLVGAFVSPLLQLAGEHWRVAAEG